MLGTNLKYHQLSTRVCEIFKHGKFWAHVFWFNPNCRNIRWEIHIKIKSCGASTSDERDLKFGTLHLIYLKTIFFISVFKKSVWGALALKICLVLICRAINSSVLSDGILVNQLHPRVFWCARCTGQFSRYWYGKKGVFRSQLLGVGC